MTVQSTPAAKGGLQAAVVVPEPLPSSAERAVAEALAGMTAAGMAVRREAMPPAPAATLHALRNASDTVRYAADDLGRHPAFLDATGQAKAQALRQAAAAFDAWLPLLLRILTPHP